MTAPGSKRPEHGIADSRAAVCRDGRAPTLRCRTGRCVQRPDEEGVASSGAVGLGRPDAAASFKLMPIDEIPPEDVASGRPPCMRAMGSI